MAIKFNGRTCFPEIKIFLETGDFVIVKSGFSKRDLTIIGNIIFNDPENNEVSNDQYLLNIWRELHNDE